MGRHRRENRSGAFSEESNLALIQVPLGEVEAGEYMQGHVNLQLNKDQARTLKQIRVGLDQSGARLRDGRRVVNCADTIRYLLENARASTMTDPE
jgi:hypothetical protein